MNESLALCFTHVFQIQNEYLEALRSLGSVLSYYCLNKRYPVFGFGARLPDDDVISHCFSLNGNEDSPEIEDLEVWSLFCLISCRNSVQKPVFT